MGLSIFKAVRRSPCPKVWLEGGFTRRGGNNRGYEESDELGGRKCIHLIK